MWYRIACHGDRICLRVYLDQLARTPATRQPSSNVSSPGLQASIVRYPLLTYNELLGRPLPPPLR